MFMFMHVLPERRCYGFMCASLPECCGFMCASLPEGLMLGAGWEMGARTVNFVATFMASCIATAAGVVAGRLQVVSGPALLGPQDSLREGDKGGPKAKAVSLTGACGADLSCWRKVLWSWWRQLSSTSCSLLG
jgi:hypothetical protein